MTIRLSIETEKVISLQEYLTYVDECVDPEDDDSIMESAGMLKALCNNPGIIDAHLIEQLKKGAFRGNPFSEQTLLLGATKKFTVRANFWLPVHINDYLNPTDEFFSYNYPHDHNFSFLTAGYYGPGYETDLFEYSYDEVIGYPGEPVNLFTRGREQLGYGEIMFYRSGRDVHVQLPPESLSISINLIARQKKDRWRDQFEFCPESKTIVKTIGDLSELRSTLFFLASETRDSHTTALLREISQKHPCRKTCYEALHHLVKWGDLQRDEAIGMSRPEHRRYVEHLLQRDFPCNRG